MNVYKSDLSKLQKMLQVLDWVKKNVFVNKEWHEVKFFTIYNVADKVTHNIEINGWNGGITEFKYYIFWKLRI